MLRKLPEKLDFLFLVEIPAREEKSYYLLCEELRRRGYSAEYLMPEEWSYRRISSEVKVVIGNSLLGAGTVGEWVYATVGKIDRVVAMRWEQIPPKTKLESTYMWKDKRDMCKTSKTINYMCWGKDFYEQSHEAGKDYKYLHLVGPVHMDFLRPAFRNSFIERKTLLNKYNIGVGKKILFFAASFCAVNYRKAEIDMSLRVRGKEKTDEKIKFDQETQKIVLDWFERFLEVHNDWVIIYRPHPELQESKLLYEFAKQHNSFHIIRDYTVQQWIVISDVVAMVNSTVIADALLAQIPTVILRPLEIPSFMDSMTYEDMDLIVDYDNFEKKVIHKEGNAIANIKKYYDFSDTPSYVRICDAFEKIYNSSEYNLIWDEQDMAEIVEGANKALERTRKSDKKNLFKLLLKRYLRRTRGGAFISKKILKSYGYREEYNKIHDVVYNEAVRQV